MRKPDALQKVSMTFFTTGYEACTRTNHLSELGAAQREVQDFIRVIEDVAEQLRVDRFRDFEGERSCRSARRGRTALMVCQAISIAITIVLPTLVASFSASRLSSGLASLLALTRCGRKPSPILPICGATSVSQMVVSTASTRLKKGRMPLNSWCRQCCSAGRFPA